MTNKLNRSIASIVLEIQKREDNEVPPHFIREVLRPQSFNSVSTVLLMYIYFKFFICNIL